MDISPELLGFLVTLGSGLSTTIGAAMVWNSRLVSLFNKKVLAAALGFAAGVMLYVSFVEIFGKSIADFVDEDDSEERDGGFTEKVAYMLATSCFFGGIVAAMILNQLVHTVLGYQENSLPLMLTEEEGKDKFSDESEKKKLKKMGIFTAVALGLHNFPEGLATFVAVVVDTSVGIPLAIAIAIHNIPEGLAVAMPIYYATGSRLKGFLWGFASGLSEPLGALLGWLLLGNLNNYIYGILFGMVAGIMVYISLHELLPTAHRYDPKDRFVTPSVLIGMVVMAASLILFTL